MAGIFARLTTGRAGAGAAHARYITRPVATKRDRKAILVRNYPEYVRDAGAYGELRDNLEEFCRQAEEDERRRPRRGGHGEVRTHYRAVLSFEGRVETERARGMAEEYLDRTFPEARAIAVVHQDTEHTHVHIHLQARDVHERKLHFDARRFPQLDRAWAEVYAREFGREKLAEHEGRKAETREWKREYARARAEGRAAPPAPQRAGRPKRVAEIRAREGHHYGADQARAGGDQRAVAGGDREAPGRDRAAGGGDHRPPGGERGVEGLARQHDRAVRGVERADREARAALQAAERVAERASRRDRALERGR
ncbi:MAG: relaxase/mobilization nuclease domain-containing protein [Chloroflexi bacterium]|nr:relaxase/mobilization nuclease domain-containing protein [Chloroflexota bacterium]